MKFLAYVWVNVFHTILRVLPFPCKSGLIKIGNPDRNSPVLLTGNFRLTVARLKRSLKGINAYLLVANSRGVNVWCAATGGLMTNHEVVSILKTSGIANLVDHGELILPQLAATGIEARVIQDKTGWRIVWGPVDAASIPAFLSNQLQKNTEMRTVRFLWPQRLEMAVAWAFPISLFALLMLPLWKEGTLPLIGLIWGLSLIIFLSFPLYQRHLNTQKKRVGWILFDFGPRGILLGLWGLFLFCLIAYAVFIGDFSWKFIIEWSLISFIVVLILGLDLTGSTPVFKSGLHEDRLMRIMLDAEKCKGAGFCEQVCPVDVFEMDYKRNMVMLPGGGRCVQCGACIVQCPFDALHFQSPKGEVVTPETVRRYKLNLLGKRLVTHEHNK